MSKIKFHTLLTLRNRIMFLRTAFRLKRWRTWTWYFEDQEFGLVWKEPKP